jgi:hypothetical protein
VQAKQALQVVSGVDWSWIRLCERKDIALRLRRSSIAGHYCAYADLQTNQKMSAIAILRQLSEGTGLGRPHVRLYLYSLSNHPSLRRNYDVREFASESSSDNQIILANQTLGLYCHAGVFLPVDIDLQCSPVVSSSRGKPSSQCQFC